MKKKIVSIFVIVCFISMFIGCGDSRIINNVEYDTYGLFNKEDNRYPDIKYKLITGNLVWGILLCSTIVAPIYFFGFSLYEPIREKTPIEIEKLRRQRRKKDGSNKSKTK
jgi:hypothetical protein